MNRYIDIYFRIDWIQGFRSIDFCRMISPKNQKYCIFKYKPSKSPVMQRILFLFLLFPAISQAQDTTFYASKFEQFTYQPGRIVKVHDSLTAVMKDLRIFYSRAWNVRDGSLVKAVTIQ